MVSILSCVLAQECDLSIHLDLLFADCELCVNCRSPRTNVCIHPIIAQLRVGLMSMPELDMPPILSKMEVLLPAITGKQDPATSQLLAFC